MPVIRTEQLINEHTRMIDAGMFGALGFNAVYLIRGSKVCLIDSGTRQEAAYLVKKLKILNAFPPDLIILTHPHWDRTQGIPLMRREARKMGKNIEVFASADAIEPLKDMTFNDAFEIGPCEPVEDVIPLREGDIIDLGNTSLRIYDLPGHCRGHIGILDTKNECIFVGDSVLNTYMDGLFMPTFMPSTWKKNEFYASLKKLKQIPYKTLCISHFACLSGEDAKSVLDKSTEILQTWLGFYERNALHLDEPDYLLAEAKKELNQPVPKVTMISLSRRVLMKLVPQKKIEEMVEKTKRHSFGII